MLGIFSYKQLALVLIVAVMAVAAIGSAAALTYDDSNLHVVQGDQTWVTDSVDVDYAIGSTGDVTATLTFGDANGYTDVSFSHDGGSNYSPCVATGAANVWDCVMTSAEANTSQGIDVVAANEN